MARYNWITNLDGEGYKIYIYTNSTKLSAVVYSTNTSTTALQSVPQLTTDSTGVVSFWVDTSNYFFSQRFDIEIYDKVGNHYSTIDSLGIFDIPYVQSGSSVVSSATLGNISNESILVGSPAVNSIITLPNAVSGISYNLIGNNNSAFTWTVNTTSGNIYLPDGSNGSSLVINFSSGLSYKMYTDGTNWYVVSTTNLHIINNYSILNKSGASEAPGLSAYGTGSLIIPDSGYYSLMPQLLTATIGGTVGTAETITAQPTITYDNSTSAVILSSQSLAAGATGNLIWDLTSIAGSYVSGGKIMQVSIAASSNASSTSATVIGNVKGQQFV